MPWRLTHQPSTEHVPIIQRVVAYKLCQLLICLRIIALFTIKEIIKIGESNYKVLIRDRNKLQVRDRF